MKDNAPVKFNKDNFGNVRAMLLDGNPWFVGKDAAQTLGYKRERDALKQHVPDKYKLTFLITLLRNNGIVVAFKSELVDRLFKMRELVACPQIERDARWIQTRLGTIISHKPFTDAIMNTSKVAGISSTIRVGFTRTRPI